MAKILIVDDNAKVRAAVRRLLVADGYEVVEADDGEAAMDVFRAEKADLVLMDIYMPNKEGLETIRDLRQEAPDVKIIAFSGGGKSRYLRPLKVATYLGAQKSLIKPFTHEQLLDAVRELLEEAPES